MANSGYLLEHQVCHAAASLPVQEENLKMTP